MKPLAVLSFLAVAAAASLVAAGSGVRQERFRPGRADPTLAEIAMQPTFYAAEEFRRAQDAASSIPPETGIRAIVVPHHLLAAPIIARMYQAASGREISTVIVVGPDHRDIGRRPFSTVHGRWLTPASSVESDPVLTDDLADRLGMASAVGPFMEEHSIGAMMPFIETSFRDARVTAVLLASFADRNDVERLSSWLAEKADERTLVVFSIDFSHYLPQHLASRNDEETAAAMVGGDIARILDFGNDHVDSPPTLATAVRYAQLAGLKAEVREHANANDFLPIADASTTSYFGIAYTPDR